MYASAQLIEGKALPWLGAPATLTFGQDIGHPFAGKSYVALPDPLSELARHQAHHLLVVLKITQSSQQEDILITASPQPPLICRLHKYTQNSVLQKWTQKLTVMSQAQKSVKA